MAEYAITGDVATLLGVDHTVGDPAALWVEASQPIILDGSTGRLGGGIRVDLADDGTFTQDGLPETVEGVAPLYRLRVDSHSLRRAGKKKGATTRWFPLTADRDLVWVVENYVDVTVISTEVAADVEAAAALGATNDTATASFVEDTGSATHAALSATIALRTHLVDTDYATLELALADLPNYGTLEVRGVHTRTTAFTVNKPCTIRFAVGGLIDVTAANVHGIVITSDYVTIVDPNIRGNTSTTAGTARAISASGTAADPLDQLAILSTGNRSASVRRWSQYGIYFSNVTNFKIDRAVVDDIAYAGIMVLSGIHGEVTGCKVTNVLQPTGFVNSYGIAISHDGSVSQALAPRSDDVTVDGNYIENVPSWEGLDTHGGKNLRFTNNRVINAKFAIAIVPGQESGATTLAPENIIVSGNILHSGRTDGVQTIGINFVGVSTAVGWHNVVAWATGLVANNEVHHFGNQAATSGCAIAFQDTRGVVCSGNRIVEPACSGIKADYNNRDLSLVGNTVVDAWTNTVAYAAAIQTGSTWNTVKVLGTVLTRATKTATTVNSVGLRTNSILASVVVDLGNDFLAATTPVAGSGATLGTVQFDRMGIRGAYVSSLPGYGVWQRGSQLLRTDAAASTSPGWVCTTAGGVTSAVWAATTAYTAASWIRTSTGKVLECVTAGTSGATEPDPTSLNDSFMDGTARWVYRSPTGAVFKTMPALAA